MFLSFLIDDFDANFGASTIRPSKGTSPMIFAYVCQIWKKSVEGFWLQAVAIEFCYFEYFWDNSQFILS